MGKKGLGLNRWRKNPGNHRLSHRKLREKAAGPSDRLSDVVMVALGVDRDNSFSTLRRYLKSWKKILDPIDKEKKL